MEARTLAPGTRQEGEVTREPISSRKVGRGNWPSPRSSLTLLHRLPHRPQERISLEAWLREGDRTTSSGFPKEGRGPGWRGLESRSRLLVARRGLSRLARKRGRSQRVREGVGVVGKSILAVPTLPRRAAGAHGPTD